MSDYHALNWPAYANRDIFYQNRGGRYSGECMFGVHNRLPQSLLEKYQGAPATSWIVSVVADTGDGYASHWFYRMVFVIGKVNGGAAQGEDWAETRLSAPREYNARLDVPSDLPAAYLDAEDRFKGWAYSRTSGRNLFWFADRCIPVLAEDGPPPQ